MQIPAFISRALDHFASADSKLDAIAKSQVELIDLRAQVAKLTSERATSEVQFAAALADEQTKNTAISADIATLKASVETEKNRANETIAGQSIAAAKLPPSSPSPTAPSARKMTMTEECYAAKAA